MSTTSTCNAEGYSKRNYSDCGNWQNTRGIVLIACPAAAHKPKPQLSAVVLWNGIVVSVRDESSLVEDDPSES